MKVPWSTPQIGTAKNQPLTMPRIVASTFNSGVMRAQATRPGTTT
jgi:uncharacterized protein (DUF2062 family)